MTGLIELTTRREYASYVDEWQRVDSAARWLKGDLLAELVTSYGDGTLARFADEVETPLNTCQELRRVAEAYPEKSRRIELPWSVHQVLASQPDRAELITAWSGTVQDARKLVRDRKRQAYPRPVPDQPEPDEPSASLRIHRAVVTPRAASPHVLMICPRTSPSRSCATSVPSPWTSTRLRPRC
jgi:hypothetical protein